MKRKDKPTHNQVEPTVNINCGERTLLENNGIHPCG